MMVIVNLKVDDSCDCGKNILPAVFWFHLLVQLIYCICVMLLVGLSLEVFSICTLDI